MFRWLTAPSGPLVVQIKRLKPKLYQIHQLLEPVTSLVHTVTSSLKLVSAPVTSLMAKEPIALAHTVLVVIGSLLTTVGFSLPFWLKYKFANDNCHADGYSGLWVSCATHCTLVIPKAETTTAYIRPLDYNTTDCTNEEICFKFEDSRITNTGLLQVVRIFACIAAFTSYISVGFAIVRALRWGFLVRKIFTWVLISLSAVSGVTGVVVFLLFLFQGIAEHDSDLLHVEHKDFASMLFMGGALVNLMDASFLTVAHNGLNQGAPGDAASDTTTTTGSSL